MIKGLNKVVILGSGPIVIGQACEFDYSGTQACKALMQQGLEVILINSNPATIMTDAEIATRVYIEPLKKEFVARVLEEEKPDALIPTLGGQTALNLALELNADGVLDRLGIKMLGARPEVIQAAEDREKFCKILDSVGAKYPKSFMVKSFEQGMEVADKLGAPLILRPNYTLGGGGGGIAFSLEEYKTKLAAALHESPTSEVLVEASILGWKEFELEVMRDAAGTFVIICSIENFDPCGVHTGDSITVAPQQTLSDREYQAMRDEAQKIVNAVGVETGGANIQFAVNPATGERVVIEMNPRVSRSSALASKATGFPIAKIAALLAVGYHLDEIANDITKVTPSCYEPALDYVVTKIPRFAFEKFPGSKDSLTTQMKSVGEVMGIGRTFKESLQKAVCSLEADDRGLYPVEFCEEKVTYPNSQRIYHIAQALREGYTVEQVHGWTQINPWFLEQIQNIIDFESEIQSAGSSIDRQLLLRAKRFGFSDASIGYLLKKTRRGVRELRRKHDVRPAYLRVDTCAGEFESSTPYFYSTYWSDPLNENLCDPSRLVTLLGSGPNRIGQGIEFDYSCVRSVRQLQADGYQVAMINSNPETVSTDYDTSDFLFFEPLTDECVGEVMDFLKPFGFICQVGGQTPIHLAAGLTESGHNLLGSTLDTIDLAEDRGRFAEICRELNFEVPESTMASNVEDAITFVRQAGMPIICRPSYVLGGSRMEIVESEDELRSYFKRHAAYISETRPCLLDQFLERALEVDVDLVRGKDWLVIGGVLEHIEAAGVHSGDSIAVVPPQRLKPETRDKIEDLSRQLANRLGILGFLNLQLAVKDDRVYMLEANPRSSRSVPFLVKATGVPLVDLGVKAMLGAPASELALSELDWKALDKVCVKGVVFPFKKFAEADSILGPEMKSTGESMGRGADYSEALLKALFSSRVSLPLSGEVFLSLRDKDKTDLLPVAQELVSMGYTLSATGGTAKFLIDSDLPVTTVKKVHEGRPHCVDRIRSGHVALVINTTSGRQAVEASFGIRRSCTDYSIPCITESDAAHAFLLALKKHRAGDFSVSPIQRPKPLTH
ncbi:MAG: carbamoyl-phosphate synthase large subunit [Pseudobdellovibrionaceae bacterium]|nr:MAG: carbamoyl-phosphate synthase large subunit [Pseudobdellovibrionaceae bacterium]